MATASRLGHYLPPFGLRPFQAFPLGLRTLSQDATLPLVLIVFPPMLFFRAQFGSSPPGEGFALLDLSSRVLSLLRDNLIEQLRVCFSDLVLERKGLVSGLVGYRFGLGVLVTLLDSHPLTATHSGSLLTEKTAGTGTTSESYFPDLQYRKMR